MSSVVASNEVEIPSPIRFTSRTWREIKALYQGTAPEVAESRDCNAMRVAVLARRFCCHTNTIFAHAKKYEWQRPAWYTLQGAQHPKGARYRAGGDAEKELLARLVACARRSCPTNEDLATDLGTSAQFIVKTVARLHGAGRIRIETYGNARRIRVVGRSGWTDWTSCRVPKPAVLPPPIEAADTTQPWAAKGTSAMIRRRQQCHTMLREAAEAGKACPSNAALGEGIGCTKRTAGYMVLELAEAGAYKLEHRSPNVRRVTFPDGAATGWTSTDNGLALNDGLTKRQRQKLRRGELFSHPTSCRPVSVRPPMVSGKIRDAQLALQRTGIVVFDRAVVTGEEPGRTWSVDGRTVDADGLVAFAAKRFGTGAPA